MLYHCLRFFIISILIVWGISVHATSPSILNKTDVRLYRQALKAYESADIKTGDKVSKKIQNNTLKGYLLYTKYFSKGYRTKPSQIVQWLNAYEDLPIASDMYVLGQQKKASLPPKKPHDLYGSASGSCSYVAREDPIDLLYGRSFSYLNEKKRKQAQRDMRQIARYLRRGKTLNAKQLIESDKVRKTFSKTDWDATRTALAFSYFLDGENDQALALSNAVLKRSGSQFPQAAWTAGLVSWRLNKTQEAAEYFHKALTHPKVYPLLQAGAAFWEARSRLKLGQFEQVGELLEIAAQHQRTFYGILAMRLLGRDLQHVWDAPPRPEDDVTADFSHPALTRFYALKQIGREEWASKELAKLYLESDNQSKSILLMISEQNDFSDELIMISGKLKNDKVRYPAPNWTPKDGWRVDKALVFAFVLQESCFNTRAKSAVGALGLMQIMPKTGRELARILKYPWSLRHLNDPAYNLSLGQNYLLKLMQREGINGNLMFTALSYNAGPGNLIKWKQKMNFNDDPLLFLESIPSRETRGFVERIMVNYWIYRSLMNQPLISLDETATGRWPIYTTFETAVSQKETKVIP